MKNKEGLIPLLVAIFLLITFIILGTIFDNSEEIKKQETEKKLIQQQCQHEFVTTSRFRGLNVGYEVISKCYKCGYAVEGE